MLSRDLGKGPDSVVEIRTESVSTDLWIKEYVTEGAEAE
jgi:hypothetical protein